MVTSDYEGWEWGWGWGWGGQCQLDYIATPDILEREFSTAVVKRQLKEETKLAFLHMAFNQTHSIKPEKLKASHVRCIHLMII